MTIRVSESIWLNAGTTCSLEHVLEVSGLGKDELQDLVETGLIQPARTEQGQVFFEMQCIVLARRARRLRDDFELDIRGVSLAMRLLERIDELEKQLSTLPSRYLR